MGVKGRRRREGMEGGGKKDGRGGKQRGRIAGGNMKYGRSWKGTQ